MDQRGSLVAMTLVGVVVLVLGTAFYGIFYLHHEHIDNLMENASGDNAMLLGLDNVTKGIAPVMVILATVIFSIVLILAMSGEV